MHSTLYPQILEVGQWRLAERVLEAERQREFAGGKRIDPFVEQESAVEAAAHQEATTPIWFAPRLAPTTIGVFDAFHDEAGRQTHLAGRSRRALMAKTPELFVSPPSIETIEVLGLKNSGAV